MATGKVVVIGLDGATFTLLKPWMAAGYLPYLKSLMDQGVQGRLQSSVPPVTSPAWQCFMTGKNPGKHGVIWFLEQKPGHGLEGLINATTCEGKTLWDLLSDDGKSNMVLNVPFSFPSPGLNGVMIGGFDTPPSQKEDFAYPPGLLREIESKFGEYQIQLKLHSLPLALIISLIALGNNFVIEPILKHCEELTHYQFQVANYLIDRHQFDFIMFYQLTPDRIQHGFWHLLDETYPGHNKEVAKKYRERILRYYSYLDAQIARLVEKSGPDVNVIVMSDHGAGPITKVFDLSSWLLEEGYIKIKKNPTSQLKLWLWKMGWGPTILPQIFLKILAKAARMGFVRRRILDAWSRNPTSATKPANRLLHTWKRFHMDHLFLSTQDIDWSKTKAFCQMGPGLIRINLLGREPLGIVPREEYTALRDEIVTKLKQLFDPATGKPVPGNVCIKEDIYEGKYAERMPDIVFVSLSECLVTSHLTLATNKIVIDIPSLSGFPLLSGHHRPDGILLARGPAFRKSATVEGATIMDLTPTILYLLGSKIPNDMDGRVLTTMFDERFLQSHPVEFTVASPVEARPVVELTEADQKAILNRLKGLGYID